jgi:hypothetical protein
VCRLLGAKFGGRLVIDEGGNRTGDAVTLHPATRAALDIGDWLPATRGNVAAHAWRLAYGEQEAAAVGIGTPGMDTSTDLVVGAVEATEEVVIDRLAEGYDPDKTMAWLSDEVGGWVRDFLADHATPSDPTGQGATCREFGITDPTGPHARVLLFELASEIAQVVADRLLANLSASQS